MDAAADVAEAGEREAEQDLWAQIREQSLGADLAAFGATSVLEALGLARVDTVLVDREIDVDGTRCRDCEHIVHGKPETCQRCGSSDVFHVDLIETMTEMAVRIGASVDFADPFPAPTDVGGVAALLRYSLAENDAEQEERERRARAEQETRERAEREPREAEAPVLGDLVIDEADSATAPAAAPAAEPAAAPVVEPVAAPVVEPPAKPAPPAAKPRPKTHKKRASNRPQSAPPAVAETSTFGRGPIRKVFGWVLLALGLFLVALGVQELLDEGALLLGAGLSAFGTMSLLPPQKKAARLTFGAVGLLLMIAATILVILDSGR